MKLRSRYLILICGLLLGLPGMSGTSYSQSPDATNETLTIPQGTLRGISSEVAILSLRNGKIVVTSLQTRTRFY